MGMVYEDGKEYLRSNVYRKSSNASPNNAVVSALDGFGALPIKSDWGPLGVVTTHYVATADTTMKDTYGSGGTMSVATAYMSGGLNTLRLVRLGTGGTNGTLVLTSGEDETDAVILTLKYPGAHEFTATVRDKIGSTTERELVIYDGAKAKETITFTAGEKEPEALEQAVTEKNSEYVTAKATENITGALTTIAQKPFEGGENPTVTTEDYLTAFEAFEPYFYNTIALDTIDSDVQALLKEYLNTSFDEGNLGIGVIGEKGSAKLETRMKNAAANDDYLIVYFGSDYETSDGSVVSGAEAIAVAAGVIAATKSNESIVNMEMPGAASVTERLKNREYEAAIKSGLLLLSLNADGKVVFDNDANTLINPNENQDEGWKAIKRAKVRHEAFYRLDIEMDRLRGKINGDPDGIATAIQRGQAVLDAMALEKKLLNPSFTLDEEKGYGADYGYFFIDAVDIDTLKRIFLNYRWKYSENS